ncbi:MAG: chemotaxis protein CheW [Chloroflexi bacterium]|nr:chemotaxis protein CheW [Chloroflexota bacterium]
MNQQKETTREHQLAVFTLEGESFGITVSAIREIIRMQAITRVPGAPDYVEGVINLRGKIIPMVDLRKRFGFAPAERTNTTRIVVVKSQGQEVGVIVDAVTEVLGIADDAVEEVSSAIASESTHCIMGIGKLKDRLIVMLDIDKLLSHGSVSSFMNDLRDAQSRKLASLDLQGEAAYARTA